MFSNLNALQSYDPLEILRLIYRLLFGGGSNTGDWVSRTHDSIALFFHKLPFILINLFAKYAIFSFFLSIGLVCLIVVYEKRRRDIKHTLMARVLPSDETIEEHAGLANIENLKWKLVEEHINSEDESKWKLAIVEADIILSELLDSLQLHGNGVGEKLKAVETGDFDHIEEAWEAHKIRNAIAHQGSEFILNQREAKRVIRLYKSVFEEFEMI